MAWSMSSASAPRTSPTTIRSGRIRSEFRTRSRIETWPLPSMFGGRDSRRTTCGCWSLSSAASSIVTMRSSSGMNDESTFSVVVFPAPVPPATMMLIRPRTQASRNFDDRRGHRAELDQVVRLVRVGGELPDRERGTVDRERRDDRVHTRTVGQARVHVRARLVDAAADLRRRSCRSCGGAAARRGTSCRSSTACPTRST